MTHDRSLPRPAELAARARAALPQLLPDLRGREAEVRIARAPGRVNLIGEHTDYNGGLALPAAIDLELVIAHVPTDDGRVELALADTGERAAFDLADPGERSGAWHDYVRGTAWALQEAGQATRGFRGVLASTIPTGTGLSSSAALELASAWAMSAAAGPAVDPMTLARICQRAENAYVGMLCGLLDQASEALAVDGSAIRLDCRSFEWAIVPLPPELEIVVCDAGSPRQLRTSAYNDRRAECFRAAAAIAAVEPGVRELRDVDEAMLERHRDRMDEVAYRRALHIVTEDRRVDETVAALEAGDLAEVGRLFAEAHASMRDLFEASSPGQDALFEVARKTPGVVATRITGGGFGGCTVNLVERGRAGELEAAVMTEYVARTGLQPRVFVVDAAQGAGFASST